MLNIEVKDLAERAGVSQATIRRGESVDGVPAIRADNLNILKQTLETAGVVFLDDGDTRTGGPGACGCGATTLDRALGSPAPAGVLLPDGVALQWGRRRNVR